jgi:hypothetical protein
MKYTGLFPLAEDEVLEFTLEPFLHQRDEGPSLFRQGWSAYWEKAGKALRWRSRGSNGCDEVGANY